MENKVRIERVRLTAVVRTEGQVCPLKRQGAAGSTLH
jgi:hypothetical protein